MTEARADKLIKTALFGDEIASKSAMHDLRDYGSAQYLGCVFDVDPASMHDSPRYIQYLTLLGRAVFAERARQCRDLYDREIWYSLTHASGAVRQAGRRLMRDHWMLDDLGRDFGDTTKHRLAMLDRIEKELRHHIPPVKPHSVQDAPPSVYKTLTLVWYDIADVPIVAAAADMERRRIKQGILDCAAPEELDPDDFTFEDWRTHLEKYVSCSDPPAVRELLWVREQRTRRELVRLLHDQGLEHIEKQLLYHIDFAESDAVTDIVRTITEVPVADGTVDERVQLQVFRNLRFVRAVQACESSRVHTSRNGMPFSRDVCFSAVNWQTTAKLRKLPLDEAAAKLAEAHAAVDAFVVAGLRPATQEHDEVFRQAGLPIADYTDRLDQASEVVHFLLDQVFVGDYGVVRRMAPEKLAAMIWKICANTNWWLRIPGLDAPTLSRFGGWKNDHGVSAALHGCLYTLKSTLIEPLAAVVITDEEDLESFTRDPGYMDSLLSRF